MRKFVIVISILVSGQYLMAQQQDCPCCTEDHTNFDFWVGTWDVTNADGTAAGKNTIEKVQGGCILKENWISAQGGFTGSSINFYNRQTKGWEQLWIDNSGSHLKLKGNRVENQMILASEEFTHTDGKVYVNRITWTLNDDGTVRQLWELLNEGVVANTLFDGLYKKTAK